MQEARVKFSHSKISEFRAILGRLLTSIMKNEFYFEISKQNLTMYVYDPELHQARLCSSFEPSFFEEINSSTLMVFSMPNLRDFFNNLGLSPIQVAIFYLQPHSVSLIFERSEEERQDELANLRVVSEFDCFSAEER